MYWELRAILISVWQHNSHNKILHNYMPNMRLSDRSMESRAKRILLTLSTYNVMTLYLTIV